MKNVSSAANGIESTTGHVDQEVIIGGAFDSFDNLFVEQVFSDDPSQASNRRHHQIDLSNACIAILGRARP